MSERYIKPSEDFLPFYDAESKNIMTDFAVCKRLNEQDKQIKELEAKLERYRYKWIKVEDYLPIDESDVFVYIADRRSVMACRFIKSFSLIRLGENGFEYHGVTHWMHLPEPPKEKSE